MLNITAEDCVRSSIANRAAAIGVCAADFECYETFSTLFVPVIREYHGILEPHEEIKQPPINWGDASSCEDLDPEGSKRSVPDCPVRPVVPVIH